MLYLHIVPVWLNVCLHISSGVGCLCCLFRFVGSQGLEFGISKCSACAFLWTYPEIRTCSIDDWWHSSLLGKQRHTTHNWRCNGPNQSAKPTKSSSAAFTPHSKKRFYAICLNATTPLCLHSEEHSIRRSRRTCKRLLTRVIYCLFRFVATHAIAGTPPYNATGALPALPTRSISRNSTTPAPSAPSTSPSTGIAIKRCMFWSD